MPRPAKGVRLYLRKRAGQDRYWVILDGRHEHGTGCREGDREQAQKALADYIKSKYQAPKTNGDLTRTFIADVMLVYLTEHAPALPDGGEWVALMADPVTLWWDGKLLSDIRAKSCKDYKDHRVAKGVSEHTVRHELSVLRAAINYYHENNGPLTAVPVITLPPPPPARQDYWLTRKQVAERIIQARRSDKKWKHIARLLLIGVYSGTRSGKIKETRWIPSTAGGWFDLDNEVYYRNPPRTLETKKKAPPARIHQRLLPHLKRWKKKDMEAGVTYVLHYYGKPIRKIRNAWTQVAIAAGHARLETDNKGKEYWIVEDGPHICRHTAATWQMQSGTDPYEAAGFLGMEFETLWKTYGHHHPNFQGKAATASGRRR